jgi:hypothetical protein
MTNSPDAAFGDLGTNIGESLVLEPFLRRVEQEQLLERRLVDSERDESVEDVSWPHRVAVGPCDRVASVHLGFGEDHRQPGLEALGFAAERRTPFLPVDEAADQWFLARVRGERDDVTRLPGVLAHAATSLVASASRRRSSRFLGPVIRRPRVRARAR